MPPDQSANTPAYPSPLQPGSVRVGVFSSLAELIHDHAKSSYQQVFDTVGLNPELLENPTNSIQFKMVGQLFDLCVEKTGMPHFGLLLGQHTGPEQVGPLALLTSCAPNVKTALNKMILHVCVHDRGGAPVLIREGESVKLGYAIYEPINSGHRYIYDASLGIMCNLMRAMCGEKWAPSEVHFSHSRPEDIQTWETFFRAPLVFNAGMDALIFPEHCLRKAIPGRDTQAYAAALGQLEAMDEAMNIGLREKVYSIVRPLIVSRTCTHHLVAETLLLHPRTLNRRLQSRDTSLREIIGEVRFEMAKQMLEESEASLTEISSFLGYDDSSVFSRSFHRWSDVSPTQWRRASRATTAQQNI